VRQPGQEYHAIGVRLAASPDKAIPLKIIYPWPLIGAAAEPAGEHKHGAAAAPNKINHPDPSGYHFGVWGQG